MNPKEFYESSADGGRKILNVGILKQLCQQYPDNTPVSVFTGEGLDWCIEVTPIERDIGGAKTESLALLPLVKWIHKPDRISKNDRH